MCHLSKFRSDNSFKRIRFDVIPSGAISTIIDFVVRTSEVVNILVYSIGMVTHFTVAVAAIYQSVKNTSFAVFLFGARRFIFAVISCNRSKTSRSIIGSFAFLKTAQFSLSLGYLLLFLKDLEYVLKLIMSPQYSCFISEYERLLIKTTHKKKPLHRYQNKRKHSFRLN